MKIAGTRTVSRCLFFLVCAAIVLSNGAARAEDVKLVASNSSDRYHLSTCKIAQKIREEELIIFKTPEEAWEAGYVPCKICMPPVPKGKENKQRYGFGPRSKKKDVEDDPDTEI